MEIAQGLNQAEAGLRIDRKRVSRRDPAFGVGEPHVLGFRDQVADGQHKAALADHHAAARALLAQRLRGEGILRN